MSTPRWLNASEDEAWRGFRRILTLLPPAIERDLRRDTGLSAADYEVLSNLSEQADNSYRLRDLADRLRWSRSRLSHQLTRMEQRGLIERRGTISDGRGAIAQLTDDGLATIERAAPGHVKSVRTNFLDHLTATELSTIAAIADRITEPLEHHTTPPKNADTSDPEVPI